MNELEQYIPAIVALMIIFFVFWKLSLLFVPFGGKKIGPTEIICYPEEWNILVQYSSGKEFRMRTTHPEIKKTFLRVIVWAREEKSQRITVYHDTGAKILYREGIQFVMFEKLQGKP